MRSSKRYGKVRQAPRISAPKLGEYLDVRHAQRRERIVRDQKYPSDYIVSRYNNAQNAIRAAIIAGEDVDARLLEKSRVLAGRVSATKYGEDTTRCCVEAVNAFRALWAELPLDGATRSMTGGVGFSVLIEGVEVTGNPIALLRRVLPKGRVETGALQLVFKKEAALEKHGGEAAAEILRRSLIAAGQTAVAAKLCLVVDVFAMKWFAAPTHRVRLTGDIEAACREIALRWSALVA